MSNPRTLSTEFVRNVTTLIRFAVQLSLPDLTDCCFKQNSLDEPSLSAPSHSSRRVHRVHQLNSEGDALAVTRLRAFQGDLIYGRYSSKRMKFREFLTYYAKFTTAQGGGAA